METAASATPAVRGELGVSFSGAGQAALTLTPRRITRRFASPQTFARRSQSAACVVRKGTRAAPCAARRTNESGALPMVSTAPARSQRFMMRTTVSKEVATQSESSRREKATARCVCRPPSRPHIAPQFQEARSLAAIPRCPALKTSILSCRCQQLHVQVLAHGDGYFRPVLELTHEDRLRHPDDLRARRRHHRFCLIRQTPAPSTASPTDCAPRSTRTHNCVPFAVVRRTLTGLWRSRRARRHISPARPQPLAGRNAWF